MRVSHKRKAMQPLYGYRLKIIYIYMFRLGRIKDIPTTFIVLKMHCSIKFFRRQKNRQNRDLTLNLTSQFTIEYTHRIPTRLRQAHHKNKSSEKVGVRMLFSFLRKTTITARTIKISINGKIDKMVSSYIHNVLTDANPIQNNTA